MPMLWIAPDNSSESDNDSTSSSAASHAKGNYNLSPGTLMPGSQFVYLAKIDKKIIKK
jgi:hypothetical protein